MFSQTRYSWRGGVASLSPIILFLLSGLSSRFSCLNRCYAAILPRRGPHIASHSVRPSVCPSVPCLFTLEPSYERTSKIENFGFRLWASVTYVLFGTRRGPHIVRPSRPHKFLFGFSLISRPVNARVCCAQLF